MSTPAATRHLGLDFGATNIKHAVVERRGDDWQVVDRGQAATGSEMGPEAVIERLIDVARQACGRWPDLATIGIGIPGLYDPRTGATVFLVNVPGEWAGRPLAGPIGAALGLPAALINDARAFGLAELRMGAGRGVSSMIGLTLGTGVGGVVAIDGRVIQGRDGTAGELGHQTIDPDGPVCGCGNRGCVESFARADRIASACGTTTAEEAVARARAGDRQAIDGLAAIAGYLGIGIANAITVVTPDRVVIGGGVAAAGDLIFEPIRAVLRQRVRTTSMESVEVVAAELGTWAGAIGSAVHGAEQAGLGTEGSAGAA